MSQIQGRWGRLLAHNTPRLIALLSGTVIATVLAAVALHLSSDRSFMLKSAQKEAARIVQEQALQIQGLVQTYEHMLGQLETQHNIRRVLDGGNHDSDKLQDQLRQFQSLFGGSIDLLLVLPNQHVISASSIVSGSQSLATFCPGLQAQRSSLDQAGVHVYKGPATGRCPSSGSLVYVRKLKADGKDSGESIWLLLEPATFQKIFEQELKALSAPAHFTIFSNDQQVILAQGTLGSEPPPGPLGQALTADQATIAMVHQASQRSSTAADSELIRVMTRVRGTPVDLQLTMDATGLLKTSWRPYALNVVAVTAVLLLLWVGGSFYVIQLLQHHQRALQASEIRFERSLDFAETGAWEWDILSGKLHWTKRIGPMFGYPETEQNISFETFMAAIHPDDRSAVNEAIQACLERNVPYRIDHRVVWPDGSVRTLRENGNVLRAADQTPLRMFGVVQDVTNLRETTRELQTVLDNVIDAIITIDRHGVIMSFNRAACQIFGYQVQDVIGQKVNLLMPEPYSQEHDNYIQTYRTTGVKKVIGQSRELTAKHKSGRVFPINIAVSTIEHDGQPMFIALIRDITQSKRAEEEIQRLAYTDQLTGLPNRRLLLDRLSHSLLSSQRTQQCGALIFIDLDHFKSLNDSNGHEMGDLLLKQIGARISQIVRECDTVARLGGDEFMVLLDNLDTNAEAAAEQAEVVAGKLTDLFKHAFDLKDKPYRASASIGIAMFGANSPAADVLIGQADIAMYQAKADGRNTYRFFDSKLQAALATRAALENDMRQGLLRDEFFLVYQPQVNAEHQTIGVEALVRWRHPIRGVVPPNQFIPLAEHDGFIIELGEWILREACTQLVTWRALPGMPVLTMSVNVSATQFKHPRFVNHVINALDSSGLDPAQLKLELTESALADDVNKLASKMAIIKQLGVSFSLDDFGTGYSSLSYLKQLPLDQLKIDRSFIMDMEHDPNALAIARTIVTLGQSLKLSVIAEGVENAEQLSALRNCGCTEFQGYYFSPPLAQMQVPLLFEQPLSLLATPQETPTADVPQSS